MKPLSTKVKPLGFQESRLDRNEWNILKSLNNPRKIQNFINDIPFNFERHGETYMSAGRALGAGVAHCFEGALIAAAALWVNGERPVLLDLSADPKEDDDHVVALFQREGYWGAISKTNHAVLRYREPIYRDARELAVSYFHEYFLEDGIKTLRAFSKPFDLSRFHPEKGDAWNWVSGQEELIELVNKLENSPHLKLLSRGQRMSLRSVDDIEIKTLDLTQETTPEGYYQ